MPPPGNEPFYRYIEVFYPLSEYFNNILVPSLGTSSKFVIRQKLRNI